MTIRTTNLHTTVTSGDCLDAAAQPAYPVCMTALEWQSVTDANEASFTVDLPAGWSHDVRLLRVGPALRRVVRAVSPDGSLRLSLHDPDLPDFYEPWSGMFVQQGVQQLAGYVSAEVFLPQYLSQRFGAAPGLRVDPVHAEPELVEATQRRAVEYGVQVRCTGASARFGFTDQGHAVEALAIASTNSFGPSWMADVCILFATGGEPDPALLHRAMYSERTSQQWQAGQNQLFANQQAINAQQSAMWTNLNQTMHNQRMGDIAAAGAANTAIHEQRVAMGEASTAAFLDRLNQPVAGGGTESPGLDAQHSWVNMMREEETVRTASGEDVQVDAGADRYFMDERNRRWVGTSGSVDANDFRAAGLNPDDFQEGQIRR